MKKKIMMKNEMVMSFCKTGREEKKKNIKKRETRVKIAQKSKSLSQ